MIVRKSASDMTTSKMKFASRAFLIQLVLSLTIVRSYSINLNKFNEPIINQHHTQNLEAIGSYNYHAPVNQRPTQFASHAVANGLSARAGGITMPANNQIETNNFFKNSFNYHPARYHQSPATTSGNAPYMAQPSSPMEPVTLSAPISYADHESGGAIGLQSKKAVSTMNQTTDLRDIHHGSQLEMALRQANSDENLFQPSPAMIVPTEHSYDWLIRRQPLSQAIDADPQKNDSTGNHAGTDQADTKSNAESTPQPTATTTTTEQSNNILSQNLADYSGSTTSLSVPALHPSSALDQRYDPMSSATVDKQNSNHQLAGEYQRLNASTSNSGTIHSTMELPNHVFYEGPATAPPPGNYYFSSSEKLPEQNGERASNAWWLLGFGHEYERAVNLTGENYLDYCSNSELLVSHKQRNLCRLHPKVISIVAIGLKMAIDECQFRFSTNRWNCSLVLQNSLSAASFSQQQSSNNQLFGEVMKQPNRERSFLNAIVAAGLAHAMTKACSRGELPEECSCDKKIKSKNNRGKIEWVACSDDIDYGARFSRDFTDQTDNESDATAMINVHNYEVGRRVFKSATDITCTCQNNENGLCLTKRCWKHLGSFSDVGDELIRRYESATHVQLSNKDPHKLRPVRRGVRKPKRKDLVYIEESPDYCSPNIRLGVLGTQNRHCNSTSMGADSCSLLCCGRGYQVIVEDVEEDCNCKFVWCCQVKCEKCKRQLTNDVCN